MRNHSSASTTPRQPMSSARTYSMVLAKLLSPTWFGSSSPPSATRYTMYSTSSSSA
jgi:hypothetical protein